MIVVKIELHSASSGAISSLGEIVIDNTRCDDPKVADYRARAYRKGIDPVATRLAKGETRRGFVLGHRRLALPVQTLVRKALVSMGY